MKIRTDFVTNSSSSGFILIQLTYRNGKETYIEPEWDSGWGDYFSSYGMDDMLYAAKTGEDLLNILQDRISNWKSLVEDKSWTASFRKEIQDLPSLDVVKSIHIEEHCYDDPDMKDKEYTYEFTDVSSYKVIVAGKHCDLFDVPQKTEPTFSANCGYYGIFSGDAVQKLQKHGWCFGNELKKEAEYKIEWEPNFNCTPNVRHCDILLTGGVILYAKRETKVWWRVQADGCGDHAQGKTELPGN